MKTCFNCGHIFNNKSLREDDHCPIDGCCGRVEEVDENIYEVRKTLNEKGYPTVHGCAGHLGGSNPFVVFENDVAVWSFDHLPKRFELYLEEAVVLTTEIKAQKFTDKLIELAKADAELFRWAESLPPSVLVEITFRIPNELDDAAFKEVIKNKFNLPDYPRIELKEKEKEIIYSIVAIPSMYKKIGEEVRAFGKGRKIRVAVRKY